MWATWPVAHNNTVLHKRTRYKNNTAEHRGMDTHMLKKTLDSATRDNLRAGKHQTQATDGSLCVFFLPRWRRLGLDPTVFVVCPACHGPLLSNHAHAQTEIWPSDTALIQKICPNHLASLVQQTNLCILVCACKNNPTLDKERPDWKGFQASTLRFYIKNKQNKSREAGIQSVDDCSHPPASLYFNVLDASSRFGRSVSRKQEGRQGCAADPGSQSTKGEPVSEPSLSSIHSPIPICMRLSSILPTGAFKYGWECHANKLLG